MLEWTRTRDGWHNGRPTYAYTAFSDNRRYHIVWTYDHGGSFGYTARDQADHKYLTDRWGIVWARTLKNCKAACETIERKRNVPT
jgi:hypothetical protein